VVWLLLGGGGGGVLLLLGESVLSSLVSHCLMRLLALCVYLDEERCVCGGWGVGGGGG
jgi:hypothetical protein